MHVSPGSRAGRRRAQAQQLTAWYNTRNAITAAYSVTNADRGATIALGGSAFYTLTFDAATGYDAKFAVLVENEDTARAKTIAPNGLTAFKIYPGQSAFVYRQGDAWQVIKPGRWRLTANTSVYVDKDAGSDTTGDGLATGSGAFATRQAAYDALCSDIDTSGKTVTFQYGGTTPVTYTDGLSFNKAWTGGGNLVFTGDTATPTNFILNRTSNSVYSFSASLPGTVTLSGQEIRTTTSGDAINLSGAATLKLGVGVRFGTCAGSHILIFHPAAYADFTSATYAIVGSPTTNHVNVAAGRLSLFFATLNISASLAWGSSFLAGSLGGQIQAGGATFSLSAPNPTGKRFDLQSNAVLNTSGAGATAIPGDAAGTATNGAQYV